jgi:hypothetical protein
MEELQTICYEFNINIILVLRTKGRGIFQENTKNCKFLICSRGGHYVIIYSTLQK